MSDTLITGAILAGGPRSSIAGQLKALMPMGEVSLIARQIREMRKLCAEIIVVTDSPRSLIEHIDPSVRLITDFYAGRGPVGGMHAALHLARHPLVWIAASDMPFVSAEAAKRLIECRTDACEAVVPIVRYQPIALHGIYDKRCAEHAAKLLEIGPASVEDLLGRIVWLGIQADGWTGEPDVGNFDFAVHGQEDLAQATEWLHPGP